MTELSEETKHSSEDIISVLEILFPKLCFKIGGFHDTSETNDDLRRDQRIACKDRFDLYFCYSFDDIGVSRSMVLKSIDVMPKYELHQFFIELIENLHFTEYLDELASFFDRIPDDRLPLFFQEMLYPFGCARCYDQDAFFSRFYYRARSIAMDLLKKMSIPKRIESISIAIQDSEATILPSIVLIVNQVELAYGRIGTKKNDQDCIIPVEELIHIEKLLKDALDTLPYDVNFLDHPRFIELWVFWQFIDNEGWKNYINRMLKKPVNIAKLLGIVAGRWSSSGGQSGISFASSSISEVIAIEDVLKGITQLKNTKEFSQLTLSQKQACVAFYSLFSIELETKDDKYSTTYDEINPTIEAWEGL